MPRPISAPSFFIGLAVFSGFFYVVCAFCIAALYNALQLRDERAATLHAALARVRRRSLALGGMSTVWRVVVFLSD
jgi:hypothetical protein